MFNRKAAPSRPDLFVSAKTRLPRSRRDIRAPRDALIQASLDPAGALDCLRCVGDMLRPSK